MIPALHRDGEVADWIADLIALSAGVLLVAWVTRRRAAARRVP